MKIIKIKKTVLLLGILLLFNKITAQQDNHFTQYMYNMSSVNPAYATGVKSFLSFGGFYRTQWVGVSGAPKTQTLFAHLPVNDKVETGFSLISDDIGNGIKKENNFSADFAYLLKMGGSRRLSLGLKAGFTTLNINYSGLSLENSVDKLFGEPVSLIRPTVGAGAYFFTDNFYAGLSVPSLLNLTSLSSQSSAVKYTPPMQSTAFFTMGTVFRLSNSFKFKPAMMSKIIKGAPLSLDLSANVLFRERFEIGVAYRLGDATSALMNINITDNIKVGYAYDYTLSALKTFNSGTHEVFVLVNLNVLGKGYNKSPRFF